MLGIDGWGGRGNGIWLLTWSAPSSHLMPPLALESGPQGSVGRRLEGASWWWADFTATPAPLSFQGTISAVNAMEVFWDRATFTFQLKIQGPGLPSQRKPTALKAGSLVPGCPSHGSGDGRPSLVPPETLSSRFGIYPKAGLCHQAYDEGTRDHPSTSRSLAHVPN